MLGTLEASICLKIAAALCLLMILTPAVTPGQTVPTQLYVWRNVKIGGGGFVTGIIAHPTEPGLMYARTDVGGAYRWDDALKQWTPITDWISMADSNLMGIESLAVDPSDPKYVYLAAGTYTNPNAGMGAILRSDDQGRSFQRADMPFRMGGNDAGRFNGERLAVDPNDGRILFFGSRTHDMWKSTDRGATWNTVESFPHIETALPADAPGGGNRPGGWNYLSQPVGIVFVVFDPRSSTPGTPTPVIYAGVSVATQSLYRSTDAGQTWHAVPGQPLGLRPNHAVLAADGAMYLSYGKEPGPNTMTDGAVWKYDTAGGEWTDITPLKPTAQQQFGYGGVAVDASNPAVLMVTTFCRFGPGDEVFRSTDGGKTWKPLLEHATYDRSNAPWTNTMTPHWMGDIEIDPFDPDRVLFTTGYGIWASTNLTQADSGKPTHWVFENDGLEETVPLGLISPPQGAHLHSALGDIDGFRHDDLSISPPARSGALFSTVSLITFAQKAPNVIVRSGSPRQRDAARAAYSLDGGTTWQPLQSPPTPPGATTAPGQRGGWRGAGAIALSADGKTIVWSARGGTFWSQDFGATWTQSADCPEGARPIADRANPGVFYAFDSVAGKLYVSTNGGASFQPKVSNFAGTEPPGGAGGMIYASPAGEGDLWLSVRGGGLYHSTDAGANFAKIDAVQECYSLGIGKPAPGQGYPALFMAGRIADVQGIFRSDDAGLTWIRINDDHHQFGWVNHVTGDPRVYGRVYFGTGGRGIIYGDPAPAAR